LDEPTSGLDSYSAMTLVTLIRDIAKQSCTMVCTIHQPSSEVFLLFEMAIFLANGSVAYCGRIDKIFDYFGEKGFPCPYNYNPADFIINLIQSEILQESHYMVQDMDDSEFYDYGYQIQGNDFNDEVNGREEEKDPEAIAPVSPTKLSSCQSCWKDQALANLVEKRSNLPSSSRSIFIQLQYLLKREVLNIVRDKDGLIGRFAVTIFLSLLLGSIFFHIGTRNAEDPVDLSSHFGAVSFILIGSMFGAAQPSLLAFPFERPMFIREYSCKTC
jgi:hypothetical protein